MVNNRAEEVNIEIYEHIITSADVYYKDKGRYKNVIKKSRLFRSRHIIFRAR